MHWVMLPTASCRSSGFIRDACRQAFEEPFNYLSQSSVVSSVRDTLRLLNVGLTWGTRQHGIARLPRPIQELIVWNHALDDTNCIIQPDLVPPKSVARASADNVSDAARAVIVRCVLSRRIGGVALNIGGDNSLQVQVKDIKTPAYDCTNSIRSTAVSCRYILDDMLRTETVERMGRAPDREVAVSLPIVLRAPVIDTLKRTVATTWSDVWTALEVVNARCVRAGKGGHAIVAASIPGTAIPITDLSVTIMDEPDPVALAGKPDGTQPEAGRSAVA
ncbi:MAG: hypothetical protein LQ349_001282 [Xanthoria aureola]|nr:MAG: hypothetical protein LQ349_001282 [Xanthoria aureola]